MLVATVVLLNVLVLCAGYSCSNRLYRGQRLNTSQYLCSRNLVYRFLSTSTGQWVVNESFPRVTSYRPPPQTLYSTDNGSQPPMYLTFSANGDLIAVDTNNTVYWRANVVGVDFAELQNTGCLVLFAKNTTTVQMLWKSQSMYSLRLVNGTTASIGRLEFFFNSTWGSIGTSGFDNTDAGVACRTLGYDTGQAVTNTYGPSSGPVWMDAMACIGSEDSFQQCSFGNAYSDPANNYWGKVADSTHNNDAAISCQGTSTLGVLSPIAHVCTDRLYVGQTLSIGDSLCGGSDGEFSLRFTNRRWDTVIELWDHLQMKWMLGMINQSPASPSVRLDSDGVMRIVGTASGLPFSLNTADPQNASFVEIQDNGVVRVIMVNGSTGWRKSPDDFCYVEARGNGFHDGSKQAAYGFSDSHLQCMNWCDTNSNCKIARSADSDHMCWLMSGFPWDVTGSGNKYFEKIPGCLSGSSCYKNSSFDRWSQDPTISSQTQASAAACTSSCDATATCVSAFYQSTTCTMNWKRMNETVDNSGLSLFYRKNPCSATDPSQVPLLLVKDCPTKLLPGSFLQQQGYLCSPNGQHVFTVEKDGRMFIDGGKWMSNNSTTRSGYLEYTLSNQLFFHLDDESTAWKFDPLNLFKNVPPGYLTLSDNGALRMFGSSGVLIWDQLTGYPQLTQIDGLFSAGTDKLVDGSSNTCISNISIAYFRLPAIPISINTSINVKLVGQNLRCFDKSRQDSYMVMISNQQGSYSTTNNVHHMCNLLTATSQECHFGCLCMTNICDFITLSNLACGQSLGNVCEITLDYGTV